MGIHQLTYDLRTANIADCIRTIRHFADAVVPSVGREG